MLAQQHDVIGIETLNVKQMMRKGDGKRRLNRGLGDAALATVLRQLDYKTRWYRSTLVKADKTYPSSKTCSGCGAVKTKLPLTQRIYSCDHCGTSLDRDLNAALNLARLATAQNSAAEQGTAQPLPAAA